MAQLMLNALPRQTSTTSGHQFTGKSVQQTISNKKVLLVANSSLLAAEVILHGLNLSKRMDASLEILHLLDEKLAKKTSKQAKKSITELRPQEAVAYIPLVNDRGLTTETGEYAKNRRNILCVVLCLHEEGLPKKKGLRQKKFNEVTKLLNCPVVLYNDSPPTTPNEE